MAFSADIGFNSVFRGVCECFLWAGETLEVLCSFCELPCVEKRGNLLSILSATGKHSGETK
jgi:hypothetical protein